MCIDIVEIWFGIANGQISGHTIVGRYYGFTLDIRVSVHPSIRQSYIHPSIHFLFPDDNLSKYQWIYTKLDRCIDFVEIWFEIANGQIRQIFTELSARDTIMAGYYSLTFLFTTVVRASLGSHVGKPSSAYSWSGGFFPEFSPTFDEWSAQYKWNILERAI